MKKFKLCAFADEAGDSLSEQIAALRENDCTKIELRNIDGKSVLDYDKSRIKEIYDELESNGISVWSLGSPIGKINITDDFESQLDLFKKALEYAMMLHTENMRIFSFFIDDESKCEMYRDLVMERLLRYIETANGSGIALCHENEKKIYGDIANRCVDIHKTFPQIKAVFDPANFVQCGENTVTAFEKLSPYIKYMHIKDSQKDSSIVPAGQGIGNIPQLLEMYDGEVLTIEPHLWNFSGLKNLEKAGDESRVGANGIKTQRIAFNLAFDSLKKLL